MNLIIPAATIILGATASSGSIAAAAPSSNQLRGGSLSQGKQEGKHRLMTWLCLEFCQETQEQIRANLAQLEAVSACM
jgi:Spy/CpxP family protein refolding chaperone